ncbi:MAG TPA: phosphatase PAP2 family protein, partial [Candidatus Acidoferrales bacterium]|nr:phosphatase PAP2 family protein [Candidatus Acidoferrales bacterium]
MPSVHAAIPALCALFALQQFGRRGLPVLVYAILVWMAVIYLGEHYLTDVIAGILLAVVVHWLVSRLVPVSAADDEVSESEVHWQVRPIAIALGLVAVAYGFGQLSVRWIGPLPVTQTFVERELLGRSPVARYLLGRVAFEHNDFAKAEVELTRSLGELPLPAQQRVVRSFLGASAYHNGHLTAAIAALEPLRSTPDDLDSLIVLSRSYVESGDYDEGIALLKEVRGRFPAAPDPLYWLTRYEYSQGEADRMQVAKAIDALRQFPPDKTESMTRSLGDLLRNDRARSGG